MSSQAKVLRGQVRQVVQEILPDFIAAEAWKHLEKKFEDRLKAMEEQQKQLLGYILRATSTPVEKK